MAKVNIRKKRMHQISLLSDSHSHIDPKVLPVLEGSDEIWHAGDVGDPSILDPLKEIAPLRAVYGNIDGSDIRSEYDLNAHFEIGGLSVLMTHIAGYPGRYNRRALKLIESLQPQLFICGHSHILKVMRDQRHNHLHMNPGAIGIQGFHQVRSLLQFQIAEGKVQDLKVVEWPRWPS